MRDILAGAQSVYSCRFVRHIFYVHAVLSLPLCHGVPCSQFLEFVLGCFCIGLSISRKKERLYLEFVARNIFLQECMANFHVTAVLSLPSCLGVPCSQFFEFGIGCFCIRLSSSKK